jgi:hypothetical protein
VLRNATKFNSYKNFGSISVLLFFLSLAIVGISNFKKFGVSWEAPGLRLNGGNTAIYIADKFGLNIVPDYYRQFPPMGENGMADHGVAYDFPLVVLERLFRIADSMQVYQFRTLMNFGVFMLGTFSIYLLAARRFNSKYIGLLTATFFVLSPRIFAAGFYSPSDMVFASFFALGINLSIRFIDNQKVSSAILAGLVCGYATDIRLLGIVAFPIIVSAYLSYHFRKISWSWKLLVAYSISFIFSVYLFFPYLWENPIARFFEVFGSLSKYNWGGRNLYFGEFISASDLPWHYIPVWISITTPIFYLVFFLLGTLGVLRELIRFDELNFEKLQDYIFLGLAVLPIFSVIALNSVLYDSWRHLFFVYPFFLLVAVKGWVEISPKQYPLSKISLLKYIATFICLIQITFWMVSNNPRQYLYFNSFAGTSNLQTKWEMDYLGLSNKDLIQFLFENTELNKVRVGIGSFTPFDMSLKVVPEDLRDRMTIVPLESKPDFIVNNFRLPSKNLSEALRGYTLLKRFSIDQSIYFELWKRK